jgi:hypothetical protein
MALNNSTELSIANLHKSIIAAGSFENDGSYPYVYNNQNSGIVMQDFEYDQDSNGNNTIINFTATDNNIIANSKAFLYNNITYTIPLIKNQVNYELVPKVVSKSNLATSFISVFPMYKTISTKYDSNGMLLYGFRYDQDPTNSYKFKTVGVRLINEVNTVGEYGFRIFLEALQYDRDADGNTTITDIQTKYSNFFNFDFNLYKVTLLITTYVANDSTDDYIYFTLDTVERDLNGNRLISIGSNNSFKLSDINLTKDNVTQCVTMPELNQSIEYSLFNVKIYGTNLSTEALEQQSYIEVKK